jgi:hypothetical protein
MNETEEEEFRKITFAAPSDVADQIRAFIERVIAAAHIEGQNSEADSHYGEPPNG